MERAKTLFTVESTGPFIYHPHHAGYRVTEQLQFRADDFASRSTLSEGEASTPAPEVQARTYLQFTVDNTVHPISNRLFAIELQSNGRVALLINLSSRGIDIRSPAYGIQKIRSQRVLVPDDEVKIHTSGLDIYVHLLKHDDQPELHVLSA